MSLQFVRVESSTYDEFSDPALFLTADERKYATEYANSRVEKERVAFLKYLKTTLGDLNSDLKLIERRRNYECDDSFTFNTMMKYLPEMLERINARSTTDGYYIASIREPTNNLGFVPSIGTIQLEMRPKQQGNNNS